MASHARVGLYIRDDFSLARLAGLTGRAAPADGGIKALTTVRVAGNLDHVVGASEILLLLSEWGWIDLRTQNRKKPQRQPDSQRQPFSTPTPP